MMAASPNLDAITSANSVSPSNAMFAALLTRTALTFETSPFRTPNACAGTFSGVMSTNIPGAIDETSSAATNT